jgi:hypothetical protein
MQETPCALTAGDVASIQVLLDLIPASAKLHGNTIVAFVDIFVDVLQGLDGGNDFDIDVAAVLPQEIGIVSDDPAIVHLLSFEQKSLASVTTSAACIGILRNGGVISEGFGKAFGAFAVN